MKTYTFRVTQNLEGYYQGEVSILASSEKAAKNKLKKLSHEELDELCTDWEQGDEFDAVGEIEIHDLINEEEE